MPSTYRRRIHFADTDAAGVVFFANYLALCHEAYEEALADAGIDLARFFADTGTIVPVAKSAAEYLRPLACGNVVEIALAPRRLGKDSFQIEFTITRVGPPAKVAAKVRTEHVCIASASRARTPLPEALSNWLDAQAPSAPSA